MSQRGLEALLRPKSIAVIGASMKPNRAGYLMMRNLLAGGFNGPVLPVTPAWKAVLGVLAWPDIASLPFTPDLAVLCTNASRNLALLEELGEKGCKTYPGVKSVRNIYDYYKQHHYETIVMGASFRRTEQILALTGCDRLTIAPNLLKELQEKVSPVVRKLIPPSQTFPRPAPMSEAEFRWEHNQDAMAVEKLSEGIRLFAVDQRKLEDLLAAKL